MGRITGQQHGGGIALTEYFCELTRLREENSGKEILLKALEDFAQEKISQLGLSS